MALRNYLAAALICLVCTSCERPDVSTTETSRSVESAPSATTSTLNPAETVSVMLGAYLHKRLGEYYQYASTADKEVKSLDSLQAEFAPTSADLVTDFLFSMTDFDIDSVRVVGDSARVFISSSTPPVGFVMREAQIVERDLGLDTDTDTKLSVLRERHRLAGTPREENHAVYRLVREEKGWRVVVGWAEMAAWLDASIAEQDSSGRQD